MLRKIYHSQSVDKFDELIDAKYEHIKSNQAKESDVSFCEVAFGAKYRRATWMNVFTGAMINLAGINAVNVFITQLLIMLKEQTEGQFPVSPGLGAFSVAVVNMIGTIFALVPVRLLGRKSIFMMGYGGMSLDLLLIGLAYLKQWNMTMFIAVCVYTFIFQSTIGGITYFYMAETTLDRATGLSLFFQFVALILIVGSFEFILESPLGPHGSFWVFSAINFAAFLVTLALLKETRGKTDFEKKTLYTPKSLLEAEGAPTED